MGRLSLKTKKTSSKTHDGTTAYAENNGRREVTASHRPCVVGIDLGTSNCVLAACANERVAIVQIDGKRSMPSYVAFTSGTYIAGEEAKQQKVLNPYNTIHDAKRLIGRAYKDKEVQEDLRNMKWSFRVVEGEKGGPVFYVQCNGYQAYSPEIIGQALLSKMKTTAEQYCQRALDGAVITVPAYFNGAQKQATKQAARLAGIKVMQVLTEPVAAALAYTKQGSQVIAPQKIIIFDLGGGTFDVAVAVVEEGIVTVKTTGGNNHLGGEDFNQRLADYILGQIRNRYGVDIRDPNLHREPTVRTEAELEKAVQRATIRLMQACENAKRALSSVTTYRLREDELWPGQARFEATVDRSTFEEINKDLFDQCVEHTWRVMQDANLDPSMIDKVVLVGGSTRMPKIKELLVGLFGDSKICDTVNPDEVVAYGAGVYAAGLTNQEEGIILDVAPHPLGIGIKGDQMAVVMPRYHRVGEPITREFTTSGDNHKEILIEVFEGGEQKASANRLLDRFVLSGIPPLPRGKAKVLVRFEVTYDGTLSATVEDLTQGGDLKAVYKSVSISSSNEREKAEEQMHQEAQAKELRDSQKRIQSSGKKLFYPAPY